MKLRCFKQIIIIILGFCLVSRGDAQSSFESKFILKVSQNRLRQTVRDLVKFGNRLGGTKSGNQAAQYIFEKFRNYGFKPELVKDPEKLTCTTLRWYLTVERPKKLKGLIQHEWLANFSPSTPLKIKQLTFVKSSSSMDQKMIDSGAILLDQHPSMRMYDNAVEAGARCILCYSGSNTYAYSTYAMIMNLRETDKNPIPVFDISNIAGQRLRKELKEGMSVTIKYSSKTVIKKGRPKTVVATLIGQTDSCYIVCAHGDSDSGGPGADDNASGDAGVLEVARILNEMVQTEILPPPKKSIKFIIWGSEYFSSAQYVKQHQQELGKVLGVINYDEIGSGKTRRCLYFEGNDIPQNHDILKLFEHIGEEYVDKKGFWKEATTNPSQGGTDSYVFLPDYLKNLNVSGIKIPSITVFTSAWNEPKAMVQTRGWHSKAWKGNPDSVNIDYAPYYHSSLDIPTLTTEKEPVKMMWGVDAVGIALLRLLWD